MPDRKVFIAGADDAQRRLDRILRRILPEAGLSEIHAALRTGRIRLDGARAEASTRLEQGQEIAIDLRLLGGLEGPAPKGPGPDEAPQGAQPSLEGLIVARSRDLLFLNKPRGLLSHGPGSLDLLARDWILAEAPASLAFVPGPLHRLDRMTSGLITFPRTAEGARRFTALLRAGALRKTYLALLSGSLEGPEDWEDELVRDGERRLSAPLGSAGFEGRGRLARSSVQPLLNAPGLCLAAIRIHTGRTHQIRAQAAAHGHALAGDLKYGGPPRTGGYFLHALALGFDEPPFTDLPSPVLAPPAAADLEALARDFGKGPVLRALDSLS